MNEKYKCYYEGQDAAEAGLPITSCDYAFDTAEGIQWIEGYKSKTVGRGSIPCTGKDCVICEQFLKKD